MSVDKASKAMESAPKAQESASEKGAHKKSSARVLPGLVFAVIVIGCTLAPAYISAGVVLLLSVFCAWELFTMLRDDAKHPNAIIGTIGAALFPYAYFFFGFAGMGLVTAALLLAVMCWYIFSPRTHFSDVAITVFGALYTGALLSSIVVIRAAVPGFWGGVLAAAVIIAIWANDVMAFVWGSRLGRNKLAPQISPNKSWEGFVAGLAGSVVIWCAMAFIPTVDMPIYQAIIGGLISGVFSVLGDLAESKIKRATGYKDSGTIMRGHGGILDRCDAMLTGCSASVAILCLFRIVAI
ncbi:MAG: phosphatidate cytidylyltransferase [Coriobacteriales bacterium]|nr:phosphatidate cytidylyltransferase [Coriobacteriales bacterium]